MDKVNIDGIDISGCPFYQYQTKEDYEMRYPESGDCEIGLAGYLFDYSRITEELEKACIDNPNCYYKQLKRLQAENERLKEENYQLQKDCQICENFIDFIPCKPIRDMDYDLQKVISQRDNYYQALQEIREMATLFHSVNENKDLDHFKNNILAKINEVIGAEE